MVSNEREYLGVRKAREPRYEAITAEDRCRRSTATTAEHDKQLSALISDWGQSMASSEGAELGYEVKLMRDAAASYSDEEMYASS